MQSQDKPAKQNPQLQKLKDREWLAAQYEQHSQAAIAQMLGCSQAHVVKCMRQLQIAARQPAARIARICPICDAPFSATQSRVREGRDKFCSRACYLANVTPTPEAIAARFWAKVAHGAPDECWEYQGAQRTPFGYGAFWMHGKHESAHVAAYLIAKGDVPPGLIVRHTCDNPPCCNPGHLVLGTHAQNTADMHERGRWHKGITAEQKETIRAMFQEGNWQQVQIADQLNVSPQVVWRVIHRPR